MTTYSKQHGILQYIRSGQNQAAEVKKAVRRSLHWKLTAIICLALVVYMAVHRPTYIVPQGLTKKVKLSVSEVTPYYLMMLARGDAANYFNVTPQTIKGSYGIFLTRIEPSLYGRTQIELKKRMAEYVRDNKSTQFFPENSAKVKGDTVSLAGNLDTFIGTKLINAKAITLHINYSVDNGTVIIQGFHYA